MDNRQLIEEAKAVMKNAYVPYSKFQVGAALLTKDGKVYRGCNVENATFGATNCAERTALFSAIAAGEKEFEKIAVVSSSGELTTPCGICRQVLLEFNDVDFEVVLEDGDDIKIFTLGELLPHHFIGEHIEHNEE